MRGYKIVHHFDETIYIPWNIPEDAKEVILPDSPFRYWSHGDDLYREGSGDAFKFAWDSEGELIKCKVSHEEISYHSRKN